MLNGPLRSYSDRVFTFWVVVFIHDPGCDVNVLFAIFIQDVDNVILLIFYFSPETLLY